MLPLEASALPRNRDELVKAITLGLERGFRLPPNRTVVSATGAGYPAVEKLLIDVTDATLRDDFRPAEMSKTRQPGITVADFQFLGKPIRREQAAITVEATLTDVRFELCRDAQNRGFLVPVDGRDGRLLIRGNQADFQAMLLPQLQAAAAQHGATIDKVECTLEGDSAQALTFSVRVQASKKVALFRASTTINCRGQLAIDDHLNVKLSGLSCTGEGILGNMVAGAVQSHLRQLESKSIPVAPYALGRLKLRDVKIHAAKELIVEARLGSG